MSAHEEPLTDLYWEVHPGQGPPMLLVHGFLSSRAQWDVCEYPDSGKLNVRALGRLRSLGFDDPLERFPDPR